MATVLGYSCFVSTVILAAKFFTRKIRHRKTDDFFWKLHKPVSGIFLLTCIMHVMIQISALNTKSIQVLISGIFGLASALILIAACHMIKEQKLKMRLHRILTVFLAGAAVIHLVCGNL